MYVFIQLLMLVIAEMSWDTNKTVKPKQCGEKMFGTNLFYIKNYTSTWKEWPRPLMLFGGNYMEGSSSESSTFNLSLVCQMLVVWAPFNLLLITRARKEGRATRKAMYSLWEEKQHACLFETDTFNVDWTWVMGNPRILCFSSQHPNSYKAWESYPSVFGANSLVNFLFLFFIGFMIPGQLAVNMPTPETTIYRTWDLFILLKFIFLQLVPVSLSLQHQQISL